MPPSSFIIDQFGNKVSDSNPFPVSVITFEPVNLDIRDLSYSTDSITAYQGGTWNIDNFPSDYPLPSAQITSLQQVTIQNSSLVVEATDLDIRDLSSSTDEVKIYYPDESMRILNSDDAVTTINYVDSNKDEVSSIVTSSASLGRKVVDTFDNSGGTTLVITRVVSDV